MKVVSDTMKAYIVTVEDRDFEVVYAETAHKAKGRGCTEHDFIDRRVKRAPEFDQYHSKGGPNKEDMRRHGWWFQCHDCLATVEPDEGAVVNGRVYCGECMPMGKGVTTA